MRIYIAIIIFSSFTHLLLAENASRFPINSTSEWRINYEIMEDTIHLDGNEIFRIYVKDDTLINSKTYFKLYKSGYAYYNPIFTFDNVYIGAIRDENNKYYFIEKNNTSENLLYDFDIETGDTIFSLVEKGMVVTSIETLDNNRKKINFHKTDFQHGECMNLNNTYLIEGIGSMGGLLYESPCNHVGFREYCLVCYSVDGNVLFNNNLTTRTCNANVAVSDLLTQKSDVDLYPIPTTKKLYIEFYNWADSRSEFQIVNLSGITIYAGNISSASFKTEIDLPNLAEGIYFIKIFNKNTYVSKRFIIE